MDARFNVVSKNDQPALHSRKILGDGSLESFRETQEPFPGIPIFFKLWRYIYQKKERSFYFSLPIDYYSPVVCTCFGFVFPLGSKY